ncbi:MAG: MraY family glycosyltransferase [Bacteroidota bacterium]
MPVLPLLLGFAVSLAASLVLVPVVARLALRFGWVDAPDGRRKIHRVPIPNVGGLAILAAALIGIGVMTLGAAELPGRWATALTLPGQRVLLGALIISLVGLVDDLRDLDFKTKFLAQFAVVALAFSDGLRITLLDGVLGGGNLALAASFALTMVWMVGMMNAVNLIDGMDGLAAGVVGIAMVGLATVHAIGGDVGYLVLVAAMTGALLGFLKYNRSPASIFMGDSGSLLLGYVLAAYALRGSSHINPVLALIIPAVVMGVPVLDILVSMLRRKVMGRPMFSADKDHIHHRLAKQMSKVDAVKTLYWLAAFLALGACAMAALARIYEPLAAVTFGLGSGVVYSFLRSVGYLPSPRKLPMVIRRREALRRAKSVQDVRDRREKKQRLVSEGPGGGPLPEERLRPVSAPDR